MSYNSYHVVRTMLSFKTLHASLLHECTVECHWNWNVGCSAGCIGAIQAIPCVMMRHASLLTPACWTAFCTSVYFGLRICQCYSTVHVFLCLCTLDVVHMQVSICIAMNLCFTNLSLLYSIVLLLVSLTCILSIQLLCAVCLKICFDFGICTVSFLL